ncbi:TolC family protein [bacterium]|nr:TolC family protein [bacterium]
MRDIIYYHKLYVFLLASLFFFYLYPERGNAVPEKQEMSLEQCINITLKNNLDIQLEALNLDTSSEEITAQKSAFDPYLTSKIYYMNSVSPNTYILEEVSKLETKTHGESLGVSQKLSTGTKYDVSITSSKQKYTASLQGLNPTYNTDLSLSIAQPLLKNLGPSINKAYISIAINNKKISMIELKKKMSDTIYSVIDAYWKLVYNIEDLKAKEKSLTLAKELLELNKTQIEVGIIASVEIYQPESAVAQREEEVIIARNAVKEAQDKLFLIMNFYGKDKTKPEIDIIPSDSPVTGLIETNLQESISRALSNNHDLLQTELNLDNLNTRLKHDKNQLLPQLDLAGNMTLDGLAGKSSYETENYPFEGDYADAYDMLLDRDYYSYNLSLNLEFPIFNRAARSSYAKSNIEKRKQIIRINQLENNIVLGVRNLVRSIETNLKRIEVTKTGRVFAEKKLEVEQEKYKLGLTTNYTVLEYQKDLAFALIAEIKSKIDYQLSIASLKSLEGTLLDDYEFSLSDLKEKQ